MPRGRYARPIRPEYANGPARTFEFGKGTVVDPRDPRTAGAINLRGPALEVIVSWEKGSLVVWFVGFGLLFVCFHAGYKDVYAELFLPFLLWGMGSFVRF